MLFSEVLGVSHGASVNNLIHYLEETKNSRIILDTNKNDSLEVFAESGLFGFWNKPTAPEDVSTARACIDYEKINVGWLIIWDLQIHMQIELITTESYYIYLLQSLWDCIVVMLLLQEMGESVKHLSISLEVYSK